MIAIVINGCPQLLSGDTDGSLLSRWTALHTTSRRTGESDLASYARGFLFKVVLAHR